MMCNDSDETINRSLVPGHILKIQVDGFYVYARVLNYKDVAIYDLKSEEEIGDPSRIIASKIMLKVFAEDDWMATGSCHIIGHIDLEKKLRDSRYWLPGFRTDGLCRVFYNGLYFNRIPDKARNKMEPVMCLTLEEVYIVVRNFYSGKY